MYSSELRLVGVQRSNDVHTNDDSCCEDTSTDAERGCQDCAFAAVQRHWSPVFSNVARGLSASLIFAVLVLCFYSSCSSPAASTPSSAKKLITATAEAKAVRHTSQDQMGFAVTRSMSSGPCDHYGCGSSTTTTTTNCYRSTTTTTTNCYRYDREFGNAAKGACAWGDIVGLHCSPDCARYQRSQPYFPTSANSSEVQFDDPLECQQACQATFNCSYFSFNTNAGRSYRSCWLRSGIDCSNQYGFAGGYVSGERFCTTTTATTQAPSTQASNSTDVANGNNAPDDKPLSTTEAPVAPTSNFSASPAPISATSNSSFLHCMVPDAEYGNMDAGSCAWADVVGLHCGADCAADVQSQSWFPEMAEFKMAQSASAQDCQSACQQLQSCDFFSFDTNMGSFRHACWLKAAVPCASGFGSRPGFESGPRNCEAPAHRSVT